MSTQPKTYKWDTPFDWLAQAAQSWDANRLYQELTALARETESDTLEALYQDDMDADGYFTALEDAETDDGEGASP